MACVALASFPMLAQRTVSVNLAGKETKVGAEVFAMGALEEQPDGTARVELYNMKKELVARYYYTTFGELPVRREFLYQGEEYLHLPVADGDTLYRHRKYMWGVGGKYSTFKGHYELWAPKSKAQEYGVVSVNDGKLQIVWKDAANGGIAQKIGYSSLTPTTVKLEGASTRYDYKTGKPTSTVWYEDDRKTSAEYYAQNGNLERRYTYNADGGYELWQYYADKDQPEITDAHGGKAVRRAVKRHEVCSGRNAKPTGELYDEEGKKLKFEPYEVPPVYSRGADRLTWTIKRNMKYPADALKERVQGRVLLQFDIDTDGSIRDIEVIESPHPSLALEAIRVTRLLKKFKPGRRDGVAVKTRYRLPINFYLPKD